MATKKVTIYPSKITTQATRSTETNTQILENKENLKSSNKSLAFWGVRHPTWKPSYLRRYPDSITTPSGSFNDPAPFTASKFKISGADKRSKVKNIWVEYKWEQISYSSTTAYGKFDKPIIKIKKGDKQLDSIYGAIPSKNRYDNCKSGSCQNVDSAELAKLHTHKLTGVSELTLDDLLNNVKIIFDPKKNTASNHCRIVIQFFRIIVEYTPYVSKDKKKDPPQIIDEEPEPQIIHPNYDISVKLDKKKALINEEYYCTLKVWNTVPNAEILSPLQVLLDIPVNTEISVVEMIGGGDITVNNGCQWYITDFENNMAQVKFICKTNLPVQQGTYIGSFFYPTTSQQGKSSDYIKIVSDDVEFSFYKSNTKSSFVQGSTEDNTSFFYVTMNASELPTGATIEIDTAGFITEETWGKWVKNTNDYDLNLVPNTNGIWKITNIKTQYIKLPSNLIDLTSQGAGQYTLLATYKKNEKILTRKIYLTVAGRKLQKEYFKLRLEDGSDVQYNDLSITEGDDLSIPLEFSMEDMYETFENNLIINGDTKRFSTKEARYASFDLYIESDEDETYENVIAYLDAYDEEYECEEIIIGADANIDLHTSNTGRTFCVIHELKTNTHNKLKFILQSDEPRETVIKLKPLNYDEYDTGKWKPMNITFKDIPDIQIKIKGPSEIIYHNNKEAEFKLQYIIQNKSNIKGEDIKFQLTEHTAFERDIYPYKFSAQYGASFNTPIFNDKKRTIYFPELSANGPEHILEVSYRARKKGIFEFAIQTVDYGNTLKDDQHYNIYRHKMLVNVTADLDVKTSVSNKTPYLNEIIDYTIKVTNRSKRQENLTFQIRDIGHYERNLHRKNDYNIIEWEGPGQFETKEDTEQEQWVNNYIGLWTLTNVQPDETNTLVLSLQPKDTGTHVINTITTDKNGNVQSFDDYVQVYEPDKKIDLNVYQAINQTEHENCCNPDILTEICDDDFITIGDEIYYVIEVINKERNDIHPADRVHGYLKEGAVVKVKIRLPKSFEYTGCATQDGDDGFEIDETGLITLHVDDITQCDSRKFCFKVIPQKKGKFVSNFILSARNTKTINKKLNLMVDSYFDERKTEHEITIYNFEKTNRYFRYELDGDNNLFKFYNKGDKSKRTVDVEKHNASKLEVYRGSTLKELVDKIKDESKYVEPELIRVGSNHLATKGYELYPNGFINRFGLLNSEVYHYTGQLPTIGNLVDYALRWDVDNWDQKVWTGKNYQNGVFSLTVNYSKIPTNFNILELTKPLNTLQVLVDRVKPFGTKAICYFSFDVKFEIKIVMDEIKSELLNDLSFNIKLEDLGLISWYNRHDNSVAIYFDLTKYYIDIDDDILISLSSQDKTFWDNKHIIGEVDAEYCVDVFNESRSRQYIEDAYDIVENLQDKSNYIKNVTISKHNVDEISPTSLLVTDKTTVNRIHNEDVFNFYFDYDINYDEKIGIFLDTEEGELYCQLIKNKLTHNQFQLIHPDGNIINTINKKNITNFKIQVQCFELNNKNKIIHFWCAINTLDYEYLGYYICSNTFAPSIFLFNKTSIGNTNNRICSYTYTSQKDDPITFSIDDNEHYTSPKYSEIYQTNSRYQWNNLNKIGKQPISLKTTLDSECEIKTIKPPKLMLRYDKFNLDRSDEIIDIFFDIKSNKAIENLNLGVFRDGTYYLPKKGVVKKIYMPHHIDNVIQEYNSTVSIQQPNITICSECLKTSLGYYNKCPYCSSESVTHQKEKQDVTICYNCGWVSDGWRTNCKHCLSKDIIRTTVDYNKTYCYNCRSMHDDYYSACPYCFSTNIIHLQNDSDMYRIYNQDITNIKPIVIQSDIEGSINVCNITIPLNKNSKKLDELKDLTLVMNVTNNNNGEYYYCETCETTGLGNPEKCPNCNESSPKYYHAINLYDNYNNKKSNLTMFVYSTVNGETSICEVTPNGGNVDGTVDIEIPILDLAKRNNRDSFNLIIDAENTIYKASKETIYKAPISNYGQEYLDKALQSIFMDMSINNFYFKSEFIDENKWDIRNIEGPNRKGIRYLTDKDETNYLSFHFDIDLDSVDGIQFYMNGLNKSLSYARMNIKVISNNQTETIKTFARSNLFEIKEEIYKKHMNTKDITIELNFYDVELNSEIIINECFLIVQKDNKKIHVPQLNEQTLYIDNYANKHYKISSQNMWGLNDKSPQYLNGKMLETGLLACFEFDNINVGDIFKIYDINMHMVYKNKEGNIITGILPITEDKMNIQLVDADVVKNNAENWGSFRGNSDGLNNLESEIINTTDEKLLDSIPILNSVYQSFKPATEDFYKVILQYAGKAGYPNDNIIVSIYDDLNNSPDVCLASKRITLPTVMKDIDIDFHITGLNTEEQYWIMIEDDSADENNYHKFRHNSHKELGMLYIQKDGVSTLYDHIALSMAIGNGYDMSEFFEYPHTCELDNNNKTFKLYDSFYRFDVQTSSNVYLNNLLIKSGYKHFCTQEDIETRDEEEPYEDEVWDGPTQESSSSESLTPYPDCDELDCESLIEPEPIEEPESR